MTDEPVLTHLDEHGRAQMVDVTAKPWTRRVAVARATVAATGDVAAVFDTMPEVVAQARAMGVNAAKKAWDLIPLCHPIQLVEVDVAVELVGTRVEIEATTVVVAPTGVEMEALTACSITGLALVDALRRVDPGVLLTDVALWRKEGGRSGVWERPG